jgi:transcription-repair coupling factor (superfamily II helicase)
MSSAPLAGRSQRRARQTPPANETPVEGPRSVGVGVDTAADSSAAGLGRGGTAETHAATRKAQRPAAAAYLPHRYIREPQHRIDVYRKLAQATDLAALQAVRTELRDRFGPLPPPVELLLQLTEVKLVAAERGISAIEVEADKLKLTRDGDWFMPGGKFPRLTRRSAQARLAEIKKLIQTL